MIRTRFLVLVLLSGQTLGFVEPITPSALASTGSHEFNMASTSKCFDKPVEPGGEVAELERDRMVTIDPGCDSKDVNPEARVGAATTIADSPSGTSTAGMAYVSTSLGCGPAATLAPGGSFEVYVWAEQTGPAELTYHRPDGSSSLSSSRSRV